MRPDTVPTATVSSGERIEGSSVSFTLGFWDEESRPEVGTYEVGDAPGAFAEFRRLSDEKGGGGREGSAPF